MDALDPAIPAALRQPIAPPYGGSPAEIKEAIRLETIRRIDLLKEVSASEELQLIQMELCRRDSVYWFNNYTWTYNPKNGALGLPPYLPFVLFPRQVELCRWLDERVRLVEEGLVEKSRDIGFTWIVGGWGLHKWLFVPGFKSGFGSRKEELVDKLGNPDSIFEKIRLLMYRLPPWMLPPGYKRNVNDNFRNIVNPDTGSALTGEAGDNIGRGGRNTFYLVDEGAHIQHPETVEAALSGNADVVIWGSSVNGPGNLFARKRFGGGLRPEQIFRFHWSDDPRKTPEWAEKKRKTMLAHLWAQEYEIDYAASIENVIVPARWVQASQELWELLREECLADVSLTGEGVGGLDIGGGKAKNVFVARFGPLVELPVTWPNPDTTDTAHRAVSEALAAGVSRLNYDKVGIGKGVMSILQRANHEAVSAAQRETGSAPPRLMSYGIATGDEPSDTVWPDGQSSKDLFRNLKADIAWIARERVYAAYEHWLFLQGSPEGVERRLSDMLLLPPISQGPAAQQLAAEMSVQKWFKTETGKIIMESKEQLARRGVASPDHWDALVLTLVPARREAPTVGVLAGGTRPSVWRLPF